LSRRYEHHRYPRRLNTDKAGYIAGEGGTVTQSTNKSTAVTLNKKSGQITMNGAALAAATTVSFTLTNSTIAATDLLVLNHVSGGTAGSYLLNAQAAAGSASINVRNITAGSLSEAIVIGFAVVKASIT
jgi:phosphoribosylaminoimidazole-succinocarboxamide synthase